MSSSSTGLDRPLRSDDYGRVALSSFAYLFSEMVSRASSVPTVASRVEVWEERLADLGREVGRRALPLAAAKDTTNFRQRPTTPEAMLSILCDAVWLRWFGKKARLSRERGSDRFFVIDDEPLVSKYIRMPADYLTPQGLPTINFSNFVAGVMEGALESCGFGAKVVAYHTEDGVSLDLPDQTMFCIQFDTAVLERERNRK